MEQSRKKETVEVKLKAQKGGKQVETIMTPDNGVRLSLLADKHLVEVMKRNPQIRVTPMKVSFKPYSTDAEVPIMGKVQLQVTNQNGVALNTMFYVVEKGK